MGYSFWLAAMDLLHVSSHRQDSTYHTFVTPVVEHWLEREIAQWVHPMKDQSDDPSHHERTLLPQSYISLPEYWEGKALTDADRQDSTYHGLCYTSREGESMEYWEWNHWPMQTDRITHTTAFVTPVVEHWMEREIAQWVHPMKDRSDDPSHHERTLLPRSYISPL